MTVQSKSVIAKQLDESAQRMQKVRERKEKDRVSESFQETEPRQPQPVDLTRR